MKRKPRPVKVERVKRRKAISVFGRVFPSVAVACRAIGVSPTVLRNRLIDPNYANFHYLDAEQEETNDVGERQFRERAAEFRESLSRRRVPVLVFGRVFTSLARASRAVGVSVPTLKRRLNDPDFPDIRFPDGDQEGTIDEDDLQFKLRVKKFLKSLSSPPVCVFGRVFPSVSQASRESGIPYYSIKCRIKDPDNPDFYYCNGSEKCSVGDTQFRERTTAFLESMSNRSVRVFVFGRVFPSSRQASKETGIPLGTLRHRLRSGNFPDYRYVDKLS